MRLATLHGGRAGELQAALYYARKRRLTRIAPVIRCSESDQARALGAARPVGRASETDAALALT